MEVDRFAWLKQDFLIIFAAGDNGVSAAEGTVASPATCKNCLVIGASEKWNEEYRSAVDFRDPVSDVCSACTFPLYCSRSATIKGQFVANASVREELLAELDPCCNDTFQLPVYDAADQVSVQIGLFQADKVELNSEYSSLFQLT